MRIANRQRIVPEIKRITDPHGVKGDTLYIGSSKSAGQWCIYEKTKQLRSVKGVIVPDNIVRPEFRYRPPSKEAGRAAAKLKPVDYFAVSKMTREIYEELSGDAIEPVKLPRNKANSLQASLITMLATYGRSLEELVEQEGSWAAAAEYLECLMPEAQALRESWMYAQKERKNRAN